MLLCIKLCIKHLQEDEYKKCDITDSLSRLCCFICTLNRATAPLNTIMQWTASMYLQMLSEKKTTQLISINAVPFLQCCCKNNKACTLYSIYISHIEVKIIPAQLLR